jgi:hypothetical protein
VTQSVSGTTVIRVLIGLVGVLLIAGALVVAAFGGVGGWIGALWMLGAGAILLIAAAIEVTRYRSEHAERSGADPGPGGGESKAVEPRFRPTDEVFVDPTSRMRMRVYSDPRTGERRYVPEA